MDSLRFAEVAWNSSIYPAVAYAKTVLREGNHASTAALSNPNAMSAVLLNSILSALTGASVQIALRRFS